MGLDKIPFSFPGSYIVVGQSLVDGDEKIVIRDIRGGDHDPGILFYFEAPQHVVAHGNECKLILQIGEQPVASLTFEDQNCLRIKIQQPGLRLKALSRKYNTLATLGPGQWEFSSYFVEVKVGLSIVGAIGEIAANWEDIGHGNLDIELKENQEWHFCHYRVAPPKRPFASYTFEACAKKCSQHFNEFLTQWEPRGTVLPSAYRRAQRQSAHTLWQNMVHASGMLKYPALYMTKNWMTNIWSWDNYFSALGLAKLEPQRAYEQLVIFESLQSEEGAFPDYANDRYISFSCHKPPLLGWTYGQLMRLNPYFKDSERLVRIYEMVKKQTQYWLTYRMSTLGLPFYTHGNDSGWDNGTFFSEGVPVITPDLTVFLVLQLRFLEQTAGQLKREFSEMQEWARIASDLEVQLIEKLWDKDAFIALKWPENYVIKRPSTLQSLMPLLLGERLPTAIKNCLLMQLSEFETPYGLATERLSSSYYRYNGYWRGPIWAPSTYLITSALDNLGENAWADTIAKKFLLCCSIGGMSENFDPQTGEGLVDCGFAWTAAVWMRYIDRIYEEPFVNKPSADKDY